MRPPVIVILTMIKAYQHRQSCLLFKAGPHDLFRFQFDIRPPTGLASCTGTVRVVEVDLRIT